MIWHKFDSGRSCCFVYDITNILNRTLRLSRTSSLLSTSSTVSNGELMARYRSLNSFARTVAGVCTWATLPLLKSKNITKTDQAFFRNLGKIDHSEYNEYIGQQ